MYQAIQSWFLRYFCDSQILNGPADDAQLCWFERNRKLFALLLPGTIVSFTYWIFMISTNQLGLFTDTYEATNIPRWYMSLTMLFGSFIAGATSEGGGAIAFPVMTLAFGIHPTIARDFSLLIQSFGMTSASVSILLMRIKVDLNAIIFASIGGLIGVMIGLDYVRLEPIYSKMYFVCIWSSFAFALYLLNHVSSSLDRHVYLEVPYWSSDGSLVPLSDHYHTIHRYINWKSLVIIVFGVVGGIFTAMAGSGLDICTFSLLVLLFRVSEKTATPSSVLIMAINTVVGALYRGLSPTQSGIEPEAIKFLLVCIPIVVFGAPLGSLVGSYCHRLVLAGFIYILDLFQLIAAIVILEPWKYPSAVDLCASSAGIMVACFIGFKILSVMGRDLMVCQEEIRVEGQSGGMNLMRRYWANRQEGRSKLIQMEGK